jgi:uncharacterized protein (TIGR03118 family)
MKPAFSLHRFSLVLTVATGTLCFGAGQASAYFQTNLVSDIPGLATITDPELKNSWGVSESATSPFWISNQGTNTSTLYSVTGGTNVSKVNINPPSGFVAIPTTASPPQGPTGQVNNPNMSAFPVGNGGNGGSAHFIFANLNGTISAWDTGTTAFIQATTASAVYTGLAINSAHDTLYAANGASGKIDVFNSSFAPTTLAGNFTDPSLPTGLVPFNVQDIGGNVYVTYAASGRSAQISATAGSGVVAAGSQLASPWGIALAPSDFGRFSGDLLVANFSYADSAINAYDPTTGAFLGSIPFDLSGNSPGGLWAIIFGNGASGGAADTLYVADGINGEADGLFFALQVPEPSGVALLGGASLALLIARRRNRAAR